MTADWKTKTLALTETPLELDSNWMVMQLQPSFLFPGFTRIFGGLFCQIPDLKF